MRLASQDVFMIFYTHLAISKCWWLISWSCSHMITLINTCLSTFRSARSGTCWFKRNHLPSQSPQCKPTCGWPISGGALQIMYCVRRHDFCRLGVLCSLRKVYFAVSDWFYHLMMTQSQCKIWAESETKSNFNFRALRQIGVLEFQQLVIVFVSIVNVGAYPVVMNDLNLNDLKGMLSQFSQFPRRICSLCPHCQSLAYGRKLLAATNTLWITVLCLAARSVTLELQDGLEPVRKLCPRAWDIGAIVRCPKVRLSLPFSTNLKRPMLSQSPEEDESFCLNPKKHRFFVPNLVLDYRSNLSSSPQCALSQTKLKCLSVCHAAAKAFS